MYRAAASVDADVVVRVTGDCPLVSPAILDAAVDRLAETGADYATNIMERTFPRGLGIEAFTTESFKIVEDESSNPIEREHVTPYYRNGDRSFHIKNVTATEVFSNPVLHNRADLRLTLDEDADYKLLSQVYEAVVFDEVLPLADAVAYVDEYNLADVNAAVKQKKSS
jgi:spore coat polysaccharide biosynthesis protein SpsF